MRWRGRAVRDPRRVVLVTAYYPPHLGGVEVVVREQAAGLVRAGASVEVLTSMVGANDSPRDEWIDGVHVRRFRAIDFAHTPIAPGMLWGLLRQPRGALMHVHVGQALVSEMVRFVCWLKGSRYVVNLHLDDVEATSRVGVVLPLWKRLVLGPTLRAAARVLALTPAMATEVLRLHRLDPARLAVLPNGVGEEYFVEGRRPAAEAHVPLRLLFVGRLERQKNVPRLLAALDLVEEPLDVVLVGDGEDRDEHLRLRDQLGLSHVRFVGREPAEGVIGWMQWADALVSTSDTEGMPLGIMEAMAAGLPIVATDVPGTRDLLYGCGLLVAPTPRAVATGIKSLVADPELRERLAGQARAAAETHTWARVCAQLLKEHELAWPRPGSPDADPAAPR